MNEHVYRSEAEKCRAVALVMLVVAAVAGSQLGGPVAEDSSRPPVTIQQGWLQEGPGPVTRS